MPYPMNWHVRIDSLQVGNDICGLLLPLAGLAVQSAQSKETPYIARKLFAAPED